MLRARLNDGTFIMGLDRVNIERLTHGEPIAINLVPLGGSDVVILHFGETLEAIKAEWERHNRGPLPQPELWENLVVKKGS